MGKRLVHCTSLVRMCHWSSFARPSTGQGRQRFTQGRCRERHAWHSLSSAHASHVCSTCSCSCSTELKGLDEKQCRHVHLGCASPTSLRDRANDHTLSKCLCAWTQASVSIICCVQVVSMVSPEHVTKAPPRRSVTTKGQCHWARYFRPYSASAAYRAKSRSRDLDRD